MNIYVGNLPYSVNNGELQSFFEQYGAVTSVSIVMDKMTGKPRGFAFVEMPDPEEATRAIEAAHGSEFNGRNLIVNEARARQEKRPTSSRRH